MGKKSRAKAERQAEHGEPHQPGRRWETPTHRLIIPTRREVLRVSTDVYIVKIDGADVNPRFPEWHLTFGADRSPHRSDIDVPTEERRAYLTLTPGETGGDQFVAFIHAATATRSDMPHAAARMVWDEEQGRYSDQIVGYPLDRTWLQRAYAGLDLLRLSWPSAGGRPKGMAEVTREAFLAEYERMRNEYKEEDTKPPTKADIGDRYGVSDDTISRFCNEQHPPITWPPKQ